ncbi:MULTISPECIES: DUF1109 domain-containing protein [Hyphobacterium]|uniref:DUF1109 domain-containing protein n=1 Tax=Hyphobacterium vulgare TaxID=1736751 RepID=A0ABV6ZVR6_9PROT
MTDPLDDLVDALEPVRPVRPANLALRFVFPALLLSAAGMAILIGVRPDMPGALALPSFWVKLAAMLAIAGAGWFALAAASRPGGSPAPGLIAGGVLVGILLLAGLANLLLAEPGNRMDALMGHSVQQCLPRVILVALPVLAGSLILLRRMAPTRLHLAGLAAGLFAGAAGAAVYSVSCTESSLTFLAVWYQLAMLAVAAIGALAGPRLLRW